MQKHNTDEHSEAKIDLRQKNMELAMSYLKSATVFDRKVMLVLRWCCRNVNDHEPRENNSKNKKKVIFSVRIYIYHPCVFMESKREREKKRERLCLWATPNYFTHDWLKTNHMVLSSAHIWSLGGGVKEKTV